MSTSNPEKEGRKMRKMWLFVLISLLGIGSFGFGNLVYASSPTADLAISPEDIYTFKSFKEDWRGRHLGVNIHNQGNTPVVAEARFFLGDPERGGILLGQGGLAIEPGNSGREAISWNVKDGEYEVFVVIDPENKILEANETNNRASKILKVISRPTTDLAISREGIFILNFGFTDWRRRYLGVSIHNRGNTVVFAEAKAFLEDPERGEILIGEVSVELQPGMFSGDLIPWDVEDGEYEVFVVIDPEDKILETDETNNRASKVLKIIPPSETKDSAGEELYQEGLFQETASGDLEAAIDIYKKIVAEHSQNRTLAARAQARIGLCYDKLGKTAKAAEAFRKLTSDFSDQEEVINEVRNENQSTIAAGSKAKQKLLQAREALRRKEKNIPLAQNILIDLAKNHALALNPTDRCYLYVYLGYIEDLAGNREAAIGWYEKGLPLEGPQIKWIRQLAESGMSKPVTWIRHLDKGTSTQSSAGRKK